jgi:hypothetical protein
MNEFDAVPSFYVGDVPHGALVFGIEGIDDVDYEDFTVTVSLRGQLGTHPVGPGHYAEGVVSTTWTPLVPFTYGGLYRLVVTFTLVDGQRRVIEGPALVVEDASSGWHTLASAREGWNDSRQLDDPLLYTYLDAARTAIEAYAPASALVSRPSESLRLAQLLQARSVWNVSKSDTGSSIDSEFGTIYVRPLDSSVKALIRPKSAVPVIT